jgi:HAD superfamily hydrolase (TIGR01490 family)
MSAAYAFFDVDDTLIAIKSMFSFQDYWYTAVGDSAGRAVFMEEMDRLRGENAPWEVLNRRYYAHFAGRSVVATAACAADWYAHVEQTTPRLYHTAVVAELRRHQQAGVEPVFVSGSFPALMAPVAQRLDVRHILATTLEETADGRYTGNILPPQTIGAGKAVAVQAFLAERGISAAHCHAYGDDISDAPMLDAVGFPTAVSGGRGLELHARSQGWRVMAPA